MQLPDSSTSLCPDEHLQEEGQKGEPESMVPITKSRIINMCKKRLFKNNIFVNTCITYNNIPDVVTSRQFSFVPEITPPFELTLLFVFISKHSFPFRKLKNLQAGFSMHAERHFSGVRISKGFPIDGPENSVLFSKQLFPIKL